MCLPKAIGARIGGPLGMLIDPGYGTAELAGKVWKPAGTILNPGEWQNAMKPKQPDYGPSQSRMDATAKAQQDQAQQDRIRKNQDAARKRVRASILTSDAQSPTSKGSSIVTGTPLGSIDGPTTGGLKSLLGT